MSDETKKVDDGGSAFPDIRNAIDWKYQPGMTLRDYFAGMALQGILSNPTTSTTKLFKTSEGFMNSEMIAECAYEQADSMIRAGKGEK
jgi:hypothetical protein